jgi:hypothetical protein
MSDFPEKNSSDSKTADPNSTDLFVTDQATDNSMQRLLRLKRYEQPPQGYYEEFLREFHYRQRAELLRPSLSTLLLERFSSWVSEIRVPAFAYAGATAVALVASVAILKVNPSSTGARASYASYSPNTFSQTPITIQKMQPVSLRVEEPSAEDSSRTFPTSYLLQAHPASHESPLSF